MQGCRGGGVEASLLLQTPSCQLPGRKISTTCLDRDAILTEQKKQNKRQLPATVPAGTVTCTEVIYKILLEQVSQMVIFTFVLLCFFMVVIVLLLEYRFFGAVKLFELHFM